MTDLDLSSWDNEPIIKKQYKISYNDEEGPTYKHQQLKLPLFSLSNKFSEIKENKNFQLFTNKFSNEINSFINDLLIVYQKENINFTELDLQEIKINLNNLLFDLYIDS